MSSTEIRLVLDALAEPVVVAGLMASCLLVGFGMGYRRCLRRFDPLRFAVRRYEINRAIHARVMELAFQARADAAVALYGPMPHDMVPSGPAEAEPGRVELQVANGWTGTATEQQAAELVGGRAGSDLPPRGEGISPGQDYYQPVGATPPTDTGDGCDGPEPAEPRDGPAVAMPQGLMDQLARHGTRRRRRWLPRFRIGDAVDAAMDVEDGDEADETPAGAPAGGAFDGGSVPTDSVDRATGGFSRYAWPVWRATGPTDFAQAPPQGTVQPVTPGVEPSGTAAVGVVAHQPAFGVDGWLAQLRDPNSTLLGNAEVDSPPGGRQRRRLAADWSIRLGLARSAAMAALRSPRRATRPARGAW